MQWVPDIFTIGKEFGILIAFLVIVAFFFFIGKWKKFNDICKRLQIATDQIDTLHHAIKDPEHPNDIIRRADLLSRVDGSYQELYNDIEKIIKLQCGASVCPIVPIVKHELRDIKELILNSSKESKSHRQEILELVNRIYDMVGKVHDRLSEFNSDLGKEILNVLKYLSTLKTRNRGDDSD